MGFDHFRSLGLELNQLNTMINQELPRRALDLSLAIYRVTAKFPVGEVLAGQLRQLSNEIAGDLAEEKISGVKNKIDRLKTYFSIAKAQNWVRPTNWSILDFEYYKMQQEVLFELGDRGGARQGNSADLGGEGKERSITSHNIGESQKVRKRSPRPEMANLPLRQDRILKVIQNKDLVKMSDLIPLFKDDISERTLRNELQDLVKSGLIKKRGTNKYTEYFKE